jgi:hypothetical protein
MSGTARVTASQCYVVEWNTHLSNSLSASDIKAGRSSPTAAKGQPSDSTARWAPVEQVGQNPPSRLGSMSSSPKQRRKAKQHLN